MQGYIKSKKPGWQHIFKMGVKPGGKVPLEDLYNMYGKKYNIQEEDFVDWLKSVKLRGKLEDWIVVAEEDAEPTGDPVVLNKTTEHYETNGAGDVVLSKMSVQDIMGLSVRKARDIIPTVQDVKLLKFALRECRPLPNKESLCRILDKRIMELGMHPNG